MKTYVLVLAGLLSAAAAAAVADDLKIEPSLVSRMDVNATVSSSAAEIIPAILKAMLEVPGKPLNVNPVVVHGDWAIAGWQHDGSGGRVLLVNGHHGWRLRVVGGDDVTKAAALTRVGLSAGDAQILSERLCGVEVGLDPKDVALFSSFEGTVVIDSNRESVGAGGHEGHSK